MNSGLLLEHQVNVRADEPEGFLVDHKAGFIGCRKTWPRAPRVPPAAAPVGNRKQNCRARNQRERGEKQLFPAHENRKGLAGPARHYRGFVSRTNPMMAQPAPSTTKTLKNAPKPSTE